MNRVPCWTEPTGPDGVMVAVMVAVWPGPIVTHPPLRLSQRSPVEEVTVGSKSRVWAVALTETVPDGAGPENGPAWATSANHNPALTWAALTTTVAELPTPDA